jgi:hypothetical protein
MRKSVLLCTAILAVSLAVPVFAQTAPPAATSASDMSGPMSSPAAAPSMDAQQQSRLAAALANNPNAQKLQEMAQNLYNTLTKAEDVRLVQLRNGFGMVRAAQVVKDDIDGTVVLCDKSNPSMKADMDRHFSAWKSKVMPAVAAQQQAMQDSINARTFERPQEVRDFLSQLDKFATFAKDQNDHNLTRVTTPEACKSLAGSMDMTSSKIVDALHKITWPGQPG